MKFNLIVSVVFVAIISLFATSPSYAITCEKAHEMYENNEMGKAEMEATCRPKPEAAPVAKADSAAKAERGGDKKPATASAQAAKPSKDDKAIKEALEALTKQLDEQNQRLAAMEGQAKAKEEASKEDFWTKVGRHDFGLAALFLFINVLLWITVIVLFVRALRNGRLTIIDDGMGALARRVLHLERTIQQQPPP